MAGADTDKLNQRIKEAEERKSRLVELYMSKDITRDEFSAARIRCDDEIAELNELIRGIEEKNTIMKQQNDLLMDISTAINEIVEGMTYEDEFYKNLLDRMIVHDKDHIDAYLNLLPHKWSYAMATAKKLTDSAKNQNRNISDTDVPISVKSPFSSG